jgi:hypothetical protein
MNDYFYSQFCRAYSLDDVPCLPISNTSLQITVAGVEKLLLSLKNGKSPGPDGLRKPDLTIDTKLIAKCLSCIFNASIDQGKLPSQWKVAHITPIHKKGALDNPGNYRPISLTNITCKIMEHIVLHYLNEKLDSILYSRQHGFRHGLSCETQLCATYHDLARSAEGSLCTHAVVLDFKKAFDKVPHSLLMQKIRNVPELDPSITNWIQDFLTNRRQRVVIKQECSDELPVSSGVPQGSVLGPTLFLIYINDLPTTLDCNVSLFADDTLLYQVVNSSADQENFQANIDSLYQWSLTWKMPFNASKCEVITFNNKSSSMPQYHLGDDYLNCVNETTYLGVVLQSNLKFTNHIANKINKAKRILGCVKMSLYQAPPKAKLMAYTALCRPIIEYASSVWDPTNKSLIHEIEMIQNNAIRFINNVKGRASITYAREKLGLHTLADRRKSNRLSLLLKILSAEQSHAALSSEYDDLMKTNQCSMTTRSAARGQPKSIHASKTVYHNSFLPRTVRELRGKIFSIDD